MDRVKVSIKEPDTFTATAYRNMNSKTGTIIENRDKLLVEFDTPADKLFLNGSPVKAFWFRKSDLEEI